MADSLGALFLKAALGPINYAGTCIMGRQVVPGMRELTPDNLSGAAQRGISAVAKEAGVARSQVERHLPMEELHQLLGRIGEAQQQAVHAWEVHAGPVGGLLEGVTDLTQDGRPPDVSLCLERLSMKVRADKAWSGPLRELSKAAFRYSELLRYCADQLDTGVALERSRGLKRLRRVVLLIASVVLIGLLAGGGTWAYFHYQGARSRVDAALAKAEICEVENIPAEDLKLASDAQRKDVEKRREQCAEQRAAAAQAAQDERRKKEEASRKAEEKRKLEAGCAKLSQGLEKGELDAEQVSAAGDSSELLLRVASGKLLAADLAPPAPELPCAATPSGKGVEKAFAEAVLASTRVWLTAEDLSDPVRAALADNRQKIRNRTKLLFGLNAEKRAQRALVTGDPKGVASALRLCDLKRSLEIVRGPYCDALAASKGPGK